MPIIHAFLTRTALIVPAVMLLSAAQAGPREPRADTAVVHAGDRAVVPPAPWAANDPADSLYRAAREALIAGENRRAANMFAEVTRRFPASAYAADALYYRAYALYRIGAESDLREALRALEEEHARFPNAATIGDADALAVRIRGALAKRGDAGSAEVVTSAAADRCEGGTGEASERRDDIRGEAMNALLQMDAQAAVPIIRQVLQRRDACSVALRKKAVFLISQKETPESESILIDAVHNDPSGAVREDAVFWLGQVRTEKAAAALEAIATGSADVRLRDKAVFALGQQRSARATAVVRRLAESGDTPTAVRRQAIFQLGQQRSPDNAQFLRELFGRLPRTDDALRKQVLFSLSQMRGVGNDRWLLGVALDESQGDDVRKHALWTAGQAGVAGSELVSLYDRLASGPLKEQLIWVLSESSDRVASDKLVDIAQHDRDPQMRKKAIFWLGQKNDPRIRQILLDIINKG